MTDSKRHMAALHVLAERVAFTCMVLYPPEGIGSRALVSAAILKLFASRAHHGDMVVA